MRDDTERCTYCHKDTTYESTNEDGLCHECSSDPEVIEDIKAEIACLEEFNRYYRQFKDINDDPLEEEL